MYQQTFNSSKTVGGVRNTRFLVFCIQNMDTRTYTHTQTWGHMDGHTDGQTG